MTRTSVTNEQLIADIRDPRDREAWIEFVDVYSPSIYRVGRQMGLQDADALDLVQQVCCRVRDKISDWKSGQPVGSFRRWLRTVARNAALDTLRRIKPDAARGGTSVQVQLQRLPGERDVSSTLLRREMQREAFRWAARRIQHEYHETTWSAFWLTMVDGIRCEDVADQLGKSIGAIYIARSRIVQRLRTELESFDWDAAEEADWGGHSS